MKKLIIFILMIATFFVMISGCEKADVFSRIDKIKEKLSEDTITNEGNDIVDSTKEYYRNKDLLDRIEHYEGVLEFKNVIKDSKRLNVLILGTERQPRTDTIILASFDPETKKADLISIPRDTYYHKPGYDTGDHRKINAALPRGGYEDIIEAVEKTLGIPVHNYIRVRYDGVKAIVNMIGGVEVNVPFDMVAGKPEVPHNYINLKEGKQVLNGDEAIQFLRFRKGNSGEQSYQNGDLGRIQAQQQFVKAAINKTLGFNLVKVIPTAIKYVKHDFNLVDIAKYTKAAVGFKMNNISMTTIPGEAEYRQFDGKHWSYFIPDEDAIKELIYGMYNVKSTTK